MIVTLTANPSLDRTIELAAPLQRGEVQRAVRVSSDPGGKGVNVARVVTAARGLAVAVLPSANGDPLLLALRDAQVPYRSVAIPYPVRVNVTVTEPDGTTTKINVPGGGLEPAVLASLAEQLCREATAAQWAVLSGSLPPGVPETWYAELIQSLRTSGCQIAVDTSGRPMHAVLAAHARGLPDLVKPNAEELAEVTGEDAHAIESDPMVAVRAARGLVQRGVRAVLATLGSRGAVLVTAEGSWQALPPPIVARSTVGAGDASLAGYLVADVEGHGPAQRLRRAVAYGAAAASLPGSQLPGPDDLDLGGVRVQALDSVLADGVKNGAASGDINAGRPTQPLPTSPAA